MTAIDHLVLTRFNLPTPGPESLVRAQEGWLRNRVALFERHTVPTMRAQTENSYTWMVYLDPHSPGWLLERLAPFADEGLFVPLYRERVEWTDVVADAREVFGDSHGELLLTTNLDNDDAVAVDFIARLQQAARRHPDHAIYLRTGLILQGDALYLRDDPENAFCSVSESWDAPVTAWRDWHNLLHEHLPVVSLTGTPAWLQVIHGQNVSNRVRGVRTEAAQHRAAFPGQLDGVTDTRPGRLWLDRSVLRPLRELRDSSRAIGKRVILRIGGKNSLDRVKQAVRRFG
ncbi:glycosyltransferase [Microbacterium sp. nov. GSS16]|uniref:glycosyltransferase n=1 Tax=Microbacterium sp. nov. GSS16 TaxID=3019890 RepID=UPI002305A951|nr:glycosyltransferase [Microbacterium sp. nov. GSS16]WCD92910.1 glycosyltransferase [Microbacterium sp. nov. GSS16]